MIVGLDEVGRGCWAGPLVAAAVVFDRNLPIIAGLQDSKKLTARRRQQLSSEIRQTALAIGIGWVWPEAIDISGITAAVKTAMTEAMQQVDGQLQGSHTLEIIIDGSYNFLPEYDGVQTIVKADGKIPEVSAASIIAKVARDTYMQTEAATRFPGYGFDAHVGYGTAAHSAALQKLGPCELHRTSFRPIRNLL